MIAVWCEWTENIVWFPTILSFLAATLAYVIDPQLANNGLYMLVVMMVVFWGVTIVCFFGARNTAKLTSFGSVAGVIIPSVLLIVFMLAYLLSGHPSHIPVSAHAFAPNFALSNLPFVASIVLIFSGMEVAGYSADHLRNEQRQFPRAMFISAAIVFVLTVLGTLAIAVVVPAKDINLTAGLMQAFQGFYGALHISWLTPVTAVLVFLGSIAGVGAWAYGPAKGLSVARGYLPPVFSRSNRYGSPVAVLLMQAALGSILSLLFVLLPSVSAAYWVLSVLTTEVICIVYILMFLSAFRMRRLKPVAQFPRGYTAGNNFSYYTLCAFGIISVTFALFVGLFPTSETPVGVAGYAATIAVGTIVLAFFPFVFLPFRKPSWATAGQSAPRAKDAGQPGAAGTTQPSQPAPPGKVES
jgi:amino acid transporter